MKVKAKLRNTDKVYNKTFYRVFDILSHVKPDDFWVILDRRVLDLSSLMKEMNQTPKNGKDLAGLDQLNMFGGMDISALFLERPTNKLEMFEVKSNSDYGKSKNLFWWNDPTCIVGGITSIERNICIRNKSKGTQSHLTVCEEDSVYEIRAKFSNLYPDQSSENTVWRKTESTCCPDGHLFLDKTLTENGITWNAKDEVVFLWMFHKDEFNTCQNFM